MTSGTALDLILEKLEGVKRSGSGYTARCPGHEDRQNSLSVRASDEGHVLLKCHAGCENAHVVAVLGLEMRDLFVPGPSPACQNGQGKRIVATYAYCDETGTLLYQVVRFDPKDFRPRRPDGRGGWRWGMGEGKRVLYRLPDLLAADSAAWVLYPEGEKDADNLTALGFTATTNVGGAGKWRPEYSEALRGRRVVLLPDNDEPGRRGAEHIAQTLHGIAGEIRVVPLPGLPSKGDVSDWLAAGGTADELVRLIEAAPSWVPTGEPAAEAFGPRPDGMLASAVTPERVSWLWEGRMAAGKATVLDGDPGLGKSTLTLDIAARMTTGAAMPGTTRERAPRGVVLLSAEDGAADTIVPRLAAAGADLGRVFIMTGVLEPGADTADGATLQHLAALEAAIREHDAGLLIVDPIMAYLGADANAHKDQDVRRTLAPLSAMLDRTGCAGMLVRHLNKAAGGAAIYRGGGSIGIIGAARFGLLVARDPDDDDARIVAPVKCNIGKEPPALRYRLESVDGGDVARVVWEDEPVSIGANELLAASGGDEQGQGERAEAQAWLRSFLEDGPQPSTDVFREARKAGISASTLRRAKKALGSVIKAEKTEFGGGWQWRLDGEDDAKMTTKHEGVHSQKGEHLRDSVSIFGRAEDWLSAQLAGGSKPEYAVMRAATAAGISESELVRAKVRLDVRAFEIPHQPGRWYWGLPAGEPGPLPARGPSTTAAEAPRQKVVRL